MTTFLQIFIPMAYFVVALASMRFVSTRPNMAKDDAMFASVPLGFFWPVAMPIFLMLYSPPKREAQLEINRKVAKQDMKEVLSEYAKMNRPQITSGQDEYYPWKETS